MAKRGRHPNPIKPLYWSARIALYPGQDDDLIAFRDSIPEGQRQNALKAALRHGGLSLVAASTADDDELTESSVNFLE